MSERALIEGLARLAEPVVPGEDPYGRLMRRRRKGRRRMAVGGLGAAVAAALAGIVLGPLGPATTGDPPPWVVDPSPSPIGERYHSVAITPWVRKLIDSPTRGSLAADREFVDDLTARLRQRDLTVVPDGTVKILFAGDVGTARLVVAARHGAGQQVGFALFDERGASPEQLANAGTEQRDNGSMMAIYPLSPYLGVSFANTAVAWGTGGVELVLVPAGCRIAVAPMAGPRTWRDEPGGDLVIGVEPSRMHRVTCDGKVHYLGAAGDGGLGEHSVRPLTEDEVSAAVAAARGAVDPAVAAQLIRVYGTASGLIGPPRLVYMGRTPGAPAEGPGFSLLVSPGPDGVWRVDLETEQGGFGFRSDADLGRPGALIVVDPRWYDPAPGERRLLVVAPREAVEVQVLAADDRVTGTFPLADGVGAVPYSGEATLRLQAVDGGGAVVGTGEGPLRSFDEGLKEETISWN